MGGYSSDVILDKVSNATKKVRHGKALYEQDGICYFEPVYNYEFLTSMLYVYSVCKGGLNVVDFGGALGSTYYRYRTLWDKLNVNWSIIEQENYVDYGKKNIPEISFYNNISEYKNNIDIVLLSSVIGYLDKPYDYLKEIIEAKPGYIIIDETAFSKDDINHIRIQHVPKMFYGVEVEYAINILSQTEMEKFFTDNEYKILNIWDYKFGSIPIRHGIMSEKTIERGFLIKNMIENG